MKRIIAAALSVLVGAFGYTIVDQAVEDRVTSLESEVIELREEVSRYHPHEQFTTSPASESTTKINGTTTRSTTRKVTTTRKQSTTSDFISTVKATESLTVPMAIGDYFVESSVSIHKYLVREYTHGGFEYISPDRYTSVPIYTRPPEGNMITYANTVVGENYIYITESSVQLTDISEKVSYSYYYDRDYSQNSTAYTERVTSIKVKCKGYTDPSLVGKNVIFYINWIGNSRPDTIISNTIKADGTFEYEAIYSCRYELMNYQDKYSFTSIKIA